MGRRGPSPTPTALKLLRGERKDRINNDEPKPREGLPTCPAGVSQEVREIWDYTLAEVAAMGVVSPADRDLLLAYCEAVALHRQVSAIIAEKGLAERSANGGVARHPAVAIQRDTAATMRSLGQEFGLTPSARTGIKVGAQPKKDGAARLLSG